MLTLCFGFFPFLGGRKVEFVAVCEEKFHFSQTIFFSLFSNRLTAIFVASSRDFFFFLVVKKVRAAVILRLNKKDAEGVLLIPRFPWLFMNCTCDRETWWKGKKSLGLSGK